MAVKTYQLRTTADEATRPTRYYICDTEAELPNSGLLEGDIAYTKDTDTLHTADSATTWDAITGGGGGAPTTADYLVGTANGSLSNEIVVGTTPGGELGGTWASPTVDATHSGSSHTAVQAAAEATAATALSNHIAAADPHTGYQKESEKGVADGYASLGSDGLVPSSQLPVAGAGNTSYTPGSFTVATGNFQVHVKTLTLSSNQRATLEGTARMVING